MIGIISDTHDNVINIQKAVDIFKKNNVEFVIHAGDIVAPASVKFFEGVMMKFIFGNCDGDRALIEEKVREHDGWEHHGSAMELKIKGKMIGVVHGDNLLMNDKMMHKGYDYFIHGHTHTPEDKKVNKTRVLCPGGHYLGDSKDTNKVILLDVEKDKAVFVEVK